MMDCASTCTLGARVMELEKKHEALEQQITANTELTAQVKSDTAQLVEVFTAAQGGAKILKYMITGLKWIATAVAAGSAIWYVATHGGNPPPTQ